MDKILKSPNFLLVCGLVLFFSLRICTSFGQLSNNLRVDNVDLKYSDEKVVITYNIANGSASDQYYVWVETFYRNDRKIEATSLTGDLGTVKGSGNKIIVWDIKKDGYAIDDEIYVKVNAKLIPRPNTGKALLKSTVWPGWGDYQYKLGRPHWMRGFLGYGCLGASVVLNGMAVKSYNDYLGSQSASGDDEAFKNSKNFYQLSMISAGVGLAMWALDYYSVFSKSSKVKHVEPQMIIEDYHYELLSNVSTARRITTRGLPPNLFAELQFSDDNGNGMLEARENAELTITLMNQGKGDALQLEVKIYDSIPDPGMIFINQVQKINVIKSGESVQVKIPITTNVNLKTMTHKIRINVFEHYGYDMDPAYLVLNAYAYQPAKLVFSGFEILDSGEGTGAIVEDGQLQAGELVKVKFIVQNTGQDIARNTVYNIVNLDPNIFIENPQGKIGDIQSGEVKEFYISLSPNKRVTTKGTLPLFLTMKEDVGKGNLNDFQLPIAMNQKPPKSNIVTIQSDYASLNRNVARFEYKSNKFKANLASVINIKSVVPSATRRPKSVGVIFGIKTYKELPPAPYADNDATLMKEYFEKVLGVEQVIINTNDQVSGFIFDDMFNPDNGELQRAIVKGETEVFIFYSGHGIPDKSGENIYLFPSDGKISRLETQGYNIEKLYQNLTKLGAKHVTVILDACFSGSSKSTERVQTENLIAQKGVKLKPKNTWLADPKFTIINSSTGEETSLGFDPSETGLFTYFFCAGLQGKADANGDKTITLGELKNYVKTNVMETSRKISGIQTPEFKGDENTVLVRY